MGKFTFRKEERLSKEKQIQELFDKGSSFYLFPFKIVVLKNPDSACTVHQVLISVSRKLFKRAVDRNLIKRRTRESYRLQKHLLPSSPKYCVGFIYTHKEILVFDEVKKKMAQALERIPKVVN